MTEIAICVPTRQRPQGLRRTLESLAELETRHAVTVIVADNDAAGREGAAMVETLRGQGYRWPLEALVVETPGIPQVRNALIARALALPGIRFVAMLDDDEAADPAWLDAMLAIQGQTGADVVGGAVLRALEGDVAAWAEQHPVLLPKTRGTSGPVALVDSTANVLVAADAFRAMGDRPFDERMALTGGSDKQLFTRMQRAGFRFAWAEDARVTELVPASRISAKWLLMRGYRVGMTDTLIEIGHKGRLQVALSEAPRIAGGIVLGGLAAAFSLDPARRLIHWTRAYRAAGKIAAIVGHHYEEYRRVHGA